MDNRKQYRTYQRQRRDRSSKGTYAKLPRSTYCDILPITQCIRWHEKGRITTTPKDSSRPNYDLEIAIKEMIDSLHIKVHIKEKHVSGHQDCHTDYQTLRHKEQLNVEADKQATEALQ
jgi:hypothetical protein